MNYETVFAPTREHTVFCNVYDALVDDYIENRTYCGDSRQEADELKAVEGDAKHMRNLASIFAKHGTP